MLWKVLSLSYFQFQIGIFLHRHHFPNFGLWVFLILLITMALDLSLGREIRPSFSWGFGIYFEFILIFLLAHSIRARWASAMYKAVCEVLRRFRKNKAQPCFWSGKETATIQNRKKCQRKWKGKKSYCNSILLCLFWWERCGREWLGQRFIKTVASTQKAMSNVLTGAEKNGDNVSSCRYN